MERFSGEQLHAMVQQAVARHPPRDRPGGTALSADDRFHPSHRRLPLAAGGDEEGACLIEPEVRCTHCGYCQSYGH